MCDRLCGVYLARQHRLRFGVCWRRGLFSERLFWLFGGRACRCGYGVGDIRFWSAWPSSEQLCMPCKLSERWRYFRSLFFLFLWWQHCFWPSHSAGFGRWVSSRVVVDQSWPKSLFSFATRLGWVLEHSDEMGIGMTNQVDHAAAKCADEIGLLGALVATGGAIPADMYDGSFAP